MKLVHALMPVGYAQLKYDSKGSLHRTSILQFEQPYWNFLIVCLHIIVTFLFRILAYN